VHGVELLPHGDQPHTLDSLYERLVRSFFKGTIFEPPETRLRAAAVAAGLSAVIVIGDCELAPGDLTRLLGTFPNCTFLLTSRKRTLFRAGSVHEVGPLELGDAIELIAQETGQDPGGLRRLQAEQAHAMAAGQVQRLLQYAAFLTFSATRPGQDPLSLLAPAEQAGMLASGLSESARSVLAALGTFGTELVPDHFAAVTGLPAEPASGVPLADAASELFAAGLVTRLSTGPGARNVAYRITGDAAAAVTALGWPPASARTAAQRTDCSRC
jgi:hypothetical protein